MSSCSPNINIHMYIQILRVGVLSIHVCPPTPPGLGKLTIFLQPRMTHCGQADKPPHHPSPYWLLLLLLTAIRRCEIYRFTRESENRAAYRDLRLE